MYFEQKFFRHSGWNFRQVCQMCISHAQWVFKGNFFSSANKNQINFFSGFFGAKLFFGKNIPARLSKLDSPCMEQRFSQSCLSWNFYNFLLVFGLWAEKFLIFVEFSKWVVKTVLKCTVQHLDEDFFGKN